MHKRHPRIEISGQYEAEPVSSPKDAQNRLFEAGSSTPCVRNSLVDSLSGRTPKSGRHRRTSTTANGVEVVHLGNGGGNADGTLQLRRVNTWRFMQAIIMQSMNSILLATFGAGVVFAADVVLHHTVFDCNDKACEPQNFMGLDLDSWRSVGGYMPEVVFAIVGINLSIVSLILQLSATRYNPFVVELFFRDSVSTFTLHFFVATAIFCLWINFLLGWTTAHFLPRISCVTMMLAVTCCTFLIIPFFKYTFAFISPKTQIDIMVSEALEAGLRVNKSKQYGRGMLQRQTRVLDSMQHLSEYALSAVHQKDAAIAFHCINNMGLVVLEVMRGKKEEQAQELFAKFRETDETLALPAFENVNDNSRSEVYSDWLLWMALFEFNSLFAESGTLLADGCQQITNAVLLIGMEGVTHNDLHTVRLVMKFFNTFMRTGVNAGNIKLCCRVLNDYRKLVESIMQSGRMDDEVVQGVQYMTYYAHIAYVKQVYFIAEIVAYDISMICEEAYKIKAPYQDAIVALLLEVDEVPDDKAQLETLRGVRKAQIKLATYYLVEDEMEMASLIRNDMADEPPERLNSIKDELTAVQSATFWELEDRGYNFEYLSPVRKAKLAPFMEIPLVEEVPEAESAGSGQPVSRRARRRITRGKSQGQLQVSPAENTGEFGGSVGPASWLEARGDLTTPGSTPSSLIPGSARRTPTGATPRVTPGRAPHTGTPMSALSKGPLSATSAGSAGSAGSARSRDDHVPLIARIPEESLRQSVDGNDD